MINILNNPMFMGILNHPTQLLRISKKIIWPQWLQLELAQHFLLPRLFSMESMDRTKLNVQTMFNNWSTTLQLCKTSSTAFKYLQNGVPPFSFLFFLNPNVAKSFQNFQKLAKAFPENREYLTLNWVSLFVFTFEVFKLMIEY